MRVLVAGGAGFVGSHLVDRLLSAGHEVVVLDNCATGSEQNIAHLSSNTKFSFIKGNICDSSIYAKLPQHLDQLFHLASPASPMDYHRLPLETLRAGSEGTRNLLDYAGKVGARLLLASTSEVYGDPEVHPQHEGYWGCVNSIGPRSVYDEAKRFAEATVAAYARLDMVEVRIARIFNTYGPRMHKHDGRALPEFISSALVGNPLPVFGDGSQTRSFCYVDDMTRGLIALMNSDVKLPVNLGNPDEVTLLQVAREVIELTGSESKIEYRELPEDDPKRRQPDITRAKSLLKWEPTVSRHTGMEKTIESFR